MSIENLSDWIWFGVVALWLLMRILPRLFRGRQGDGERPVTQAAAARPKPPRPRAARTSGERISVPELPGHEQDPRVRKRLQSPTPIEPR